VGEEIYQVHIYVCAALLAVCLQRYKCILLHDLANINNFGYFSRSSENIILLLK